jgi:hypothetical protein
MGRMKEGSRWGGDLTNVQCKAIQSCYNNDCMLIKMKKLGNYLRSSGWAHCNHISPLKVEERGRGVSVRIIQCQEDFTGSCCHILP